MLPALPPANADRAAGQARSPPHSPTPHPWQDGASGPGGSAQWSARPAAGAGRCSCARRFPAGGPTPRKRPALRQKVPVVHRPPAAEPAHTGPQRHSRYTFRRFPLFYTAPVLFPAHKESAHPRPALPRGRAARWHWQTVRGRFRQGPARGPPPRGAAAPGSWMPPVPEWPCSIPLPDCCWAYPTARPVPCQGIALPPPPAAAKLRAPAASWRFSSVR